MKHYNLRNEAQNNGGFTDLFILGTTRNTNGTSDFTAAALTQLFNLQVTSKGDVLVQPLVAAWVKRSFTDAVAGGAPTTLANGKLDIGTTALGASAIIAGTAGDLIQTLSPVPDSNMYPCTAPPAASINTRFTVAGGFLTATVSTTAGNLSTITFGEVWIYAAIARVNDWMRDRDA